MTRLVIFDLDGTLLNTIDDLAASTNYALRQHRYPEHEKSAYPYFVGNGINKLMERAMPVAERTPEKIQELRRDFIHYYSLHSADFTRPYEGIPELLQALHNRAIRLAVASNKYQEGTEELVRHYFNAIPFQAVLGQRAGIPVKPDPAIVNEILSSTGLLPADTLYVGDSGVDMQTALNSGIDPVGVTWGFRTQKELEENGARYIVEHPREIIRLLD